jgi:hypothetical protein
MGVRLIISLTVVYFLLPMFCDPRAKASKIAVPCPFVMTTRLCVFIINIHILYYDDCGSLLFFFFPL